MELKILHIATQAPGHTSGGEIGTLLFSYALNNIKAKVDYIGPEIKDEETASWYHKVVYLENPISRLEKIWTLLHCYFDRHYIGWKKEKIDFNRYQIIFVEFTKMGYFIRDIYKSGYKGKIIVRAHNVEHDFFKVNFEAKKSIINGMKYLLSKKRERYMVTHCDLVLAITEQDKKRLVELYGVDPKKIDIFPIGVNIVDFQKSFDGMISKRMKCLITGSLWFGPNSDATLWFLREVYPDVVDICDLTVAGFHPIDSIKTVCRQNHVRLVDSPESMEPYFKKSEMVLAPIFNGGGMKVKIAEAMSYGIPVVTTDHGNIGYNLVNYNNGFIANTSKEFSEAIRYYYGLGNNGRCKLLNNAWNTYTQTLSLNAASKRCEKIIEKLLEK